MNFRLEKFKYFYIIAILVLFTVFFFIFKHYKKSTNKGKNKKKISSQNKEHMTPTMSPVPEGRPAKVVSKHPVRNHSNNKSGFTSPPYNKQLEMENHSIGQFGSLL